MPYNSFISRAEASPLMPEDVSAEIFTGATEASTTLQVARRLQDMPRQVRRLPVVNSLPVAYFVDNKGDGGTSQAGLKQTSDVTWSNVYLYAEEIAVIVPIPENVLEDSEYDVWAQISPNIAEAFGRTIDAAILHGTNKPSDWPAAIATGAASAGHTIDLSTRTAAGDDLYDIILGEGGMHDLVYQDGFDINGHIAALSMRARLRGTRDGDGVPIFQRDPAVAQGYTLDGSPILFPKNGSFGTVNSVAYNSAGNLMFAGDWSQLVYAFRKDMTMKLLTEGVITDNTGAVIFNLPQQDMVALRVVMRLGFALPNPISSVNDNGSTRYPFSVLVP